MQVPIESLLDVGYIFDLSNTTNTDLLSTITIRCHGWKMYVSKKLKVIRNDESNYKCINKSTNNGSNSKVKRKKKNR